MLNSDAVAWSDVVDIILNQIVVGRCYSTLPAALAAATPSLFIPGGGISLYRAVVSQTTAASWYLARHLWRFAYSALPACH